MHCCHRGAVLSWGLVLLGCEPTSRGVTKSLPAGGGAAAAVLPSQAAAVLEGGCGAASTWPDEVGSESGPMVGDGASGSADLVASVARTGATSSCSKVSAHSRMRSRSWLRQSSEAKQASCRVVVGKKDRP